MKVELKKQIAAKKIKIDGMAAQIAATKCSWWDAMLTLGISCIIKGKEQAKLK